MNFAKHRLFFHPENAFPSSRPSRHRSHKRFPGQDHIIMRLHMGVRADDGGNFTVQMPAHCDFFRSCLRMKIDNDAFCFLAHPFDQFIRFSKRTLERRAERCGPSS